MTQPASGQGNSSQDMLKIAIAVVVILIAIAIIFYNVKKSQGTGTYVKTPMYSSPKGAWIKAQREHKQVAPDVSGSSGDQSLPATNR